MKKQNAYYIVWNTSKQNFSAILNDIQKKVIIKEKNIFKIEKYYNLICDLYSFNNQQELGVFKANKMCNDIEFVIMVLFIEFPTKDLNDYSLIKTLKQEIRNKYKISTKDYFHDNIIHSTDSFAEYQYVKKIVKNIKKY